MLSLRPNSVRLFLFEEQTAVHKRSVVVCSAGFLSGSDHGILHQRLPDIMEPLRARPSAPMAPGWPLEVAASRLSC